MSNKNFKVKNGIDIGTHAIERVKFESTSPPATVNFDVLSYSILYYLSPATQNWTLNIRGNENSSLSEILEVGNSITLVLICDTGSSFYQNSLTVDGVSKTPRWQGSSPTSNSGSMDIYSFTIIKLNGSEPYLILASVAGFE